MSTFSGLSTALSSLIAQRQAIDVTGQNIANARTPGYTRQRADLQSVQALSAPTLHSNKQTVGNGVVTTGITRIGDIFLDSRVRAESSSAGFSAARAGVLGRIESSIDEPSDTGVSAQLQAFWAGWQDLSGSPQESATRRVLLGEAQNLVAQISDGYRVTETQWSQLRTETQTLVTNLNSTAESVADLNKQIRAILVSGGAANELMDQRDLLVTELSSLAGAQARHREDGTVDVMLSGNAIVSGINTHKVEVTGSFTMAGGIGQPPAALDQVALRWAGSGTALTLEGGRLASNVAELAPADQGGSLAIAADAWNALATKIHGSVNALHGTGQTLTDPPGPAGDFFALAAGQPAATGLSVAISDPWQIAAGVAANGALDGSLGDRIAQLGAAPDGPDAQWREYVVDLGVRTRQATTRAGVIEASRQTAEQIQLSYTSVDIDEETTNLLAMQRSYEGAARVLTAIDEMLDVLINRTGVVGR